ncbi:MAG TPA: sigma 54-interacting transcriptional regulator, partial [Candidatus Binatia bacterium]|nr:sigma 54-interacting transcriptional regulator [Candidatus Binatia bacterium]
MSQARTVGELRASGYQQKSVKQELRDNLIARLRKGEAIFPGIVGYEESVLPQIENAILSGQDIVFLGERGQAKTRMARLLIELLDAEVPGLAGCEINDDPFAPICQACRERVAERGDKAEITWIPRDRRYGEKLATPDITIADLIGEVDPIKVAEGRYLADELTIHYGLVPRTNRGIFAINELPDLAERIQVGLLNIMEERDVQIRGYKVRLPIDVYVVASANPEDYTNRGRIITPLKDRFGSQIRTHYPKRLEDEIAIMEAELTQFTAAGFQYAASPYMKQIVAELTHLARKAPEISQRSGVSVRVSICNWENLLSNALKRAIRLDEREVAPRVSDLGAIVASTSGKIELETLGDGGEDKVLGKLVQKAVLNVFNRSFTGGELDPVVAAFQGGFGVDAADSMPSKEYVRQIAEVRPL